MAASEETAYTTKSENKRSHCQLNKKQTSGRKFPPKYCEILLKKSNTEHVWEVSSVFLVESSL